MLETSMGVRWATSIRLACRLAPAASEDAESHVTRERNQQDVIATDWEHIQQDVIATDEWISHRMYSAPVCLPQRSTEVCHSRVQSWNCIQSQK